MNLVLLGSLVSGEEKYKKIIVHFFSKCLPCAGHINSGDALGLKTDIIAAFTELDNFF